MLNLLTNYLLHYRQVSLPSVGTLRLVQLPAQLNVADKLLLPPSFTTELTEGETIPDHQLQFLSAASGESRDTVLQALEKLGSQINEQMNGEGFRWNGLGLVRRHQPLAPVVPDAWPPVAAERVLRPDAEHRVLVGDQHRMVPQAVATAETEEPPLAENKRSVIMILGWVLLLLAILYILFVLYQGGFKIGAAGLRQPITSVLPFSGFRQPTG